VALCRTCTRTLTFENFGIGRVYYLKADSSEQCDEWIEDIFYAQRHVSYVCVCERERERERERECVCVD